VSARREYRTMTTGPVLTVVVETGDLLPLACVSGNPKATAPPLLLTDCAEVATDADLVANTAGTLARLRCRKVPPRSSAGSEVAGRTPSRRPSSGLLISGISSYLTEMITGSSSSPP
jgi:hypothetical protein